MVTMERVIVHQSLAVRAWASTCVYVVIHGVAFLFMAGPASQQLASLANVTAQRTLTFLMWLVTVTVLTVGALLLHYTANMMMERRYLERRPFDSDADAVPWRENVAFASRGVFFALLAAGLFAAIGVMATGQLSPALLTAALLAFVVPGATAGVLTHAVTPGIVAEPKQMVVVSGAAVVVVALAAYVLTGTVEPLMALSGR